MIKAEPLTSNMLFLTKILTQVISYVPGQVHCCLLENYQFLNTTAREMIEMLRSTQKKIQVLARGQKPNYYSQIPRIETCSNWNSNYTHSSPTFFIKMQSKCRWRNSS